MTILQRLQLHKLGYTKDEINELDKAEFDPKGLEDPPKDADTEPAEQPKQEEQPAEGQTDPNAEILKAIKDLTSAIQKTNIQQSRQPEPKDETAEDVLYNLL